MEYALTMLACLGIPAALYALWCYIDTRNQIKSWRDADDAVRRGMSARYDLAEFKSVRGKHRFEG